MDLEHDELVWRYRLCWVGFQLSALALGLLCLSNVGSVLFLFTRDPNLGMLLKSPFWNWGVGATITFGSFLGSFLLLGRWKEADWQRRVGLLVSMNFVDVLTWFVHHAEELGLKEGVGETPWMLDSLTQALGWAELMIFAGLAADVAEHLGMATAPFAGRVARTFLMVGATIWAAYFIGETEWKVGWPFPRRPPGMRPVAALAFLSFIFLYTIGALQVSALCAAASRQCRRMLNDLARSRNEDELLKSRSELGDPF
jgi:hypothetical protein